MIPLTPPQILAALLFFLVIPFWLFNKKQYDEDGDSTRSAGGLFSMFILAVFAVILLKMIGS